MSNDIAVVRQQLAQMSGEFQSVLPEHVTPERFQRVTLTALQKTPDLLRCDRKSLFQSVMNCATDGLTPDGREAALVKFGNNVTYMPMVGGLLKLARQSGEISTLTAQVVYEGDEFQYWIDDQGEHIKHVPDLLGEQTKARCVYAMARTQTGETYVEVLRLTDVEKIRKASRGGDRGPWKDWWDEMAKKSAIRRLFKRLPRSTDRLNSAVERDDQFYDFKPSAARPAKQVADLDDVIDQEPEVIQEQPEVIDTEPQNEEF